jgi:hypothetical protein
MDEFDAVNGGDITVVIEKGYVGIESGSADMASPYGRPEAPSVAQ